MIGGALEERESKSKGLLLVGFLLGGKSFPLSGSSARTDGLQGSTFSFTSSSSGTTCRALQRRDQLRAMLAGCRAKSSVDK